MKIHIVQKGDTLWNLAQKYGVDFEELLQANSHLANPDLLMPGMKVKIPTIAVPAKKEHVKGKVVAPVKKAVKKEVKEITKELPKMEWESPESPEIVEEIDVVKVKEMVKKTAPHVLKKLIVEHKPEVVQQIQIEIINQQETEVKMAHMAPPPKALPYIPPKPMPQVAPMALEPCPPLKPMHWGPMHCPKCGTKKHHGMHHGMHHVSPMMAGNPPPAPGGVPYGQYPYGASPLPGSGPYTPQTQPWEMGGMPGQNLGGTPQQYAPGYGMMPGTQMGGFPGLPGSMMPGAPLGGYGEQYMQPGMGMGPLGNYGYFGENLPGGSYMRGEEEIQEEQQD